VPIAKGVNVKNVNVRGCNEEILGERVEYMPRVKVQEGSSNIKTKGTSKGHQDDTTISFEEVLEECCRTVCYQLELTEGPYDEVDGQDDDVKLDDTEEDKGGNICVF